MPRAKNNLTGDLLASNHARPPVPEPGALQGNGTTSIPLPGTNAPCVPVFDSQPALPARLVYRTLTGTEEWLVEKFELLAAEFNLALAPNLDWSQQMAHLHEVGLSHTRQWLIVRQLFGIAPMIMPENAVLEDFEAKSRAQISEVLGLNAAELQAELDALRLYWRNYYTQEVVGAQPQPEEEAPPPHPGPLPQGGEGDRTGGEERQGAELKFGHEILARHGFEDQMFEAMVYDPKTNDNKGGDAPRNADKNRLERNWFAGRVTQWDKLLSEPMSSAIARAALWNELYLRRYEAEMGALSPSSHKFRELQQMKKETEQQLQKQTDKLTEMFPEFGVADKMESLAVLSTMNRAHREYYGRGDKRLINKINTANEVEILVRTSVQMPQPRIRLGLHVAIIEAIHGLYDPEFRPQFKHAVLRKMDAAGRAAIQAVRESSGEKLVDLEKGVLPGEGDEFEELKDESVKVEV